MRGKALVLEEADGRLKVSEFNLDLRDQLAAKTVDEVETVLVVTPVQKLCAARSAGKGRATSVASESLQPVRSQESPRRIVLREIGPGIRY